METPLTVLVPAFITSELKSAFTIGFMLYIPFIIIDMVVASVLMSMGMMMLSPMIISCLSTAAVCHGRWMDAPHDLVNGQLCVKTDDMETTEVIGIGREAIWTVIYVAGPVLIIALSVGLIIGVFQAATSIQEMTLSFIPKLAALVAALLIFGDWQLTILSEMFITIFDMIPQIFSR